MSGCRTISHNFLWSLDLEATRTKVVGRRVAEGVWDLEGYITHSGVAEEWVHMATIRRSHSSQTLEQILGRSFSGFLEDFGGGACYQGLMERVVVEYREPWLALDGGEQVLELWTHGDTEPHYTWSAEVVGKAGVRVTSCNHPDPKVCGPSNRTGL